MARALITRPAVIFADEPTGNLDSASGRDVLDLLRRAVDEFGQTIVMVTHDAARGRDRRSRPVPRGRPSVVDEQPGLSVDDILDRLKALA